MPGGSTPRDWLAVYLKGVAMGAADTVPAVSGGPIAPISGIYERLEGAMVEVDHRSTANLRSVAQATYFVTSRRSAIDR